MTKPLVAKLEFYTTLHCFCSICSASCIWIIWCCQILVCTCCVCMYVIVQTCNIGVQREDKSILTYVHINFLAMSGLWTKRWVNFSLNSIPKFVYFFEMIPFFLIKPPGRIGFLNCLNFSLKRFPKLSLSIFPLFSKLNLRLFAQKCRFYAIKSFLHLSLRFNIKEMT